ncbi:hypothetical protein [Staphylococcus auricularis]|uniref:Uncharacterized protein n=1 Tax=Staphylococcus auricularis TaxID=29379 RepID=A0ABX5IG17_9STAP|nr:hypothetical protein [Staphylococcus auricularis]MCE5039456.1 hypothetical protein [Staphylococcus auricularis]MEB6570007.1 hypothetical protein [Staphylococcus auricularis]PTH18360.1 hypothetical protein BU607_05330 [Staphylococcus auricularis]PTH27285.1 hypothetical protein BU608_01895 [Staphylococcus auricularis]
MAENSEQYLENQRKFERNTIHLPYLGFAIIVLLANIIYPDINLMMVLFGLFFLYNGGIFFVSFIKHFKRTMLLTFLLTILSLGLFVASMFLYAKSNNLI